MSSLPLAEEVSSEPDPIALALQGSTEAFGQLVAQHHRIVRAFIGRMVQERDVVDDLAQEAFLAAYQNLTAYARDGEFLSWVLGIARHKTLSYLRSKSRRLRRERSLFEQEVALRRLERAEDSTPDGEGELLLQQQLRQCLEALAPQAREAVERHYFRHESAEAIAAAGGRKAGAVRMLLLRVRKVLAECLSRKTEGREVLR